MILDQSAPEMRTIFLLDAMTGMRRGEILALKWRNIDWLNDRDTGRSLNLQSENQRWSAQVWLWCWHDEEW
jgi:integrase